jgi:hypothetical protein
MAEGERAASSGIWAIALIIIVAMILGVVWYSGALSGGSDKKNIEVTVPAGGGGGGGR